MRKVEDMNQVMLSLQDLYKTHITTESPERREYFRKFAFFLEILFKALVVVYISISVMFFLYPIFGYVIQNELVTFFPLYFPFVDEKSIPGYTFLIVLQGLTIILAVIGFFAFDYSLTVAIISTMIFGKLISTDLKQMDRDLQENDAALTARSRFRNVLLMHKEVFE